MKTTILFIIAIAFAFVSQAQIVNIPDANFKSALIDYGIDTSGDGEIQVSEAEAAVDLYLPNKNISDMAGLEAFINILALECSYNNISTLDISSNPNITHLACNNNYLSGLNVSGHTNLYALDCWDNYLPSLDVSGCTALWGLECHGNNLLYINTSNCGDLININCYDNQIEELDFSDSPGLQILLGWNNNINTLNISNNTGLQGLSVYNNQLTSLDLSNHTFLNDLNCSSNQLSSLSIKNGNNVNIYTGGFDITNNPNLECVEVDSVAWANANLTNIDAQSYFSINCAFQISESHTDIACNGSNDGYITIMPSGGLEPYTFDWVGTNGFTANTQDITNLEAGVYCVTVTDTILEIRTLCVTITEPDPIEVLVIDSNTVTCYGEECTGFFEVTATGGTPTYSFNWDNGGPTTPEITDLCAGSYFITVTDANGCQAVSQAMIVEENPMLMLMLDYVTNATNGICNGSAGFDYSMGGASPHSYVWNTGVSGLSTGYVCPGDYEITLTDSVGCQVVATLEVGSSYDGAITFVDTLNPVIDTCIFDNTNPVDSALIYDYNLVGADSIQLNWIFWQAGVSITLDMTVFLETTGSNLVYLEIVCNGSKSINSATTYNFYGMFDTQTIGIKELENSSLSVYPNPTTGQIQVVGNNIEQIEIYNLSGVLIQSTNSKEVDLSQEAKGIYFVKLITKEGTTTEKIILE